MLGIPPVTTDLDPDLERLPDYRSTAVPSELCDQIATLVSQRVLDNWRAVESCRSSNIRLDSAANASGGVEICVTPSVAGADQLVRRLQLDSSGIAANARSLVELQLGGDAEAFLEAWFAKQSSTRGAGERVKLQTIDRIFGADVDAAECRKIFFLGQSVASIVQPLGEKLRSELRRWLISRIDDTRERLVGARRAIGWLNAHFNDAQVELQQLRRTVVAKLLEIRQDAVASDGAQAEASDWHSAGGVSQRVLDYFRLRLDQLAISAAERTVHVILSDARAVTAQLTALAFEIDQIAAAVSRSANAGQVNVRNDEATPPSVTLERLDLFSQEKLSELAAEVDVRLQADYISQHGGLLTTIIDGGRPRAQLSAKLHELSRHVVQRALAEPVHCPTDISWTPLIETSSSSAPGV
jgi:hypothetical protein